MFTPEEVSYRLVKQASFLNGNPAAPSLKILPRKANFNVKRTRTAKANEQVQADGFEREFANGNHIVKASGSLVMNLNFLGYIMLALCGSLTSVAFSGVYAVNMTNNGSGYTSAPVVTFTAGTGGSGTTAVAVVLGGQVIGVVITNPGTGWTGAPTVVFTGGGGTGAAATAVLDATKFKHTGKLVSGAPLYWLLEKGVSTYWRQYLNVALTKLTFHDDEEGICEVDTEWTGSGHMNKTGATLDAAAAEVTGTPAEYANLSIMQAGPVTGIIDSMTTTIDITAKEKRAPGFGGKATELRKGGSMVTVEGSAFFEDEATLAAVMEAGTLQTVQTVLTSPDGIFTKLYPETKYEVDDWEAADGGVMLPFKGHSLKKVDANAPILLTLINGTASY
jgi:hypothetical protein